MLQLLEAYSVTRTIPLVILQKKFELVLEQEPKGISLDLRGAVVEGMQLHAMFYSNMVFNAIYHMFFIHYMLRVVQFYKKGLILKLLTNVPNGDL